MRYHGGKFGDILPPCLSFVHLLYPTSSHLAIFGPSPVCTQKDWPKEQAAFGPRNRIEAIYVENSRILKT